MEEEEHDDSGGDDEDEDEDFDGPDPRVAELKQFIAASNTPEDCAAKLQELGGQDAIVCGSMLTGRSGEDFAKAHFVMSCVLDQGGKLTEEIVANKALLKACLACTAEAQIGALTAMELLIVKVLACHQSRTSHLSQEHQRTRKASRRLANIFTNM